MGIKPITRVRCQLSTDFSFHDLPLPSSCGLDFWQSPAALRWQASFLNAQPAVIRVTADSSSALLCCLLRRLPLGFALASAYPYGMICGDVDLFWRSGYEIAAALKRRQVVRLEIPFSGEYAHQLARLGTDGRYFRRLQRLDAIRHVLDMESAKRDPDWLMSRLESNTRWAIRKATRSGCTVRQASASDLDVIQSLYSITMSAKGAPVNYGRERFQGMLEDLSHNGHAKVYLGQLEGRPAGIAAVVDGAISRHFIQLAVLPEAQSSRLSELLVAAVIHGAHVDGKRYFDFMASHLRDTGLIAFKAKWGAHAEAINYVVLRVNKLMGFTIDMGRWLNIRRARAMTRAP